MKKITIKQAATAVSNRPITDIVNTYKYWLINLKRIKKIGRLSIKIQTVDGVRE